MFCSSEDWLKGKARMHAKYLPSGINNADNYRIAPIGLTGLLGNYNGHLRLHGSTNHWFLSHHKRYFQVGLCMTIVTMQPSPYDEIIYLWG